MLNAHAPDAYVAEGSGTLPTTVLLHGLGSAATPFGPLLGRMRKHVRRIVAPDYPGHGFSENAARLTPEALFGSVTHALDALVDEPALVVGNSLGGAVALNYTISNPGKVRALVLVSPAGALTDSSHSWAAQPPRGSNRIKARSRR